MTPWTVCAWLAAAIVLIAISASLWRLPLQLTDSLVPMLQMRRATSAYSVFVSQFSNGNFLRPLFWTQIKLVLDASNGEYFLVFKSFHVVLLAALMAGYTAVARVRDRVDAVVFAWSLAVLVGIHTFRGSVWEAYPINHYLEISVCCVLAFWIASTRGSWWADVSAILLFLFAALTIESGLLVWVVLAGARLMGATGVSRRALAIATLLLAGYFWLRFGYLDAGIPDLSERKTGFGFGRMSPDAVAALFHSTPSWLYAYNVTSSILSVLLSEPRAGTWHLTDALLRGTWTPGDIVNLTSSLIVTIAMGVFVHRRWAIWRAGQAAHHDRIIVVAALVIAGNAAIGFVYTKDEVLGTAGVFYALAGYVAMTDLLHRLERSSRTTIRAVAFSTFTLVSVTWSIRAAGLHYHVAYNGFRVQNQWATVDAWLTRQNVVVSQEERDVFIRPLQQAAIEKPILNSRFFPPWSDRWFK